jgi:hypothetical protein
MAVRNPLASDTVAVRLRNATALGSAALALAAASVADTASAGYIFGRGFDRGFYSYRAPQPNQSLPGATSRAPNRDMRGGPWSECGAKY